MFQLLSVAKSDATGYRTAAKASSCFKQNAFAVIQHYEAAPAAKQCSQR